MHRLNIAIVGCGGIAHLHQRLWRKLPETQVVAVCDVNEKLADQFARQYKIPGAYAQLSELLARESISLVDICTPPNAHLPLAVQAMEAGYHVLLEKPMAMTTEEAGKMVRCQKVTRVKLGVIHNFLFDPVVLRARSIIDRGDIGEIVSVERTNINTKDDRMFGDNSHWCHTLPVGRLGESVVHDIYVLQHFLGRLEVGDVTVVKTNGYPWTPYDEAMIIFKSGKGLGMVHHSYDLSRISSTTTIYGKKAILKIEHPPGIITKFPSLSHIADDDRSYRLRFGLAFDVIWRNWQSLYSLAYLAMKVIRSRGGITGHEIYFRLFVDSLLRGKELPVSVEDAYEATKVLEEVCNKI